MAPLAEPSPGSPRPRTDPAPRHLPPKVNGTFEATAVVKTTDPVNQEPAGSRRMNSGPPRDRIVRTQNLVRVLRAGPRDRFELGDRRVNIKRNVVPSARPCLPGATLRIPPAVATTPSMHLASDSHPRSARSHVRSRYPLPRRTSAFAARRAPPRRVNISLESNLHGQRRAREPSPTPRSRSRARWSASVGTGISCESCDGDQCVRSDTTVPPFMTHRTLRTTTPMSASGSPSTATMSA